MVRAGPQQLLRVIEVVLLAVRDGRCSCEHFWIVRFGVTVDRGLQGEGQAGSAPVI